MPLDAPQLDYFKALLRTSARNEIECGSYLPHASYLLTKVAVTEVIDAFSEHRAHYGDTDFIVVFEAKNAFGRIERQAAVWEIKAPQCFIMERDGNDNRCRPTADLVKAENQLLHYHYELYNSDDFRRRYRINSKDNIKMGGIIIGRDDTIIDRNKSPNLLAIAQNSLEIRSYQIYDRINISVFTWDRIAEYLSPSS